MSEVGPAHKEAEIMASHVHHDHLSDITGDDDYDLRSGFTGMSRDMHLDDHGAPSLEPPPPQPTTTTNENGTSEAPSSFLSPSRRGGRRTVTTTTNTGADNMTTPDRHHQDDSNAVTNENYPTFLSPFSSKTCLNNGEDCLKLSLNAARPVSIVVYVTNPAKTSMQERIPCVFPPMVALEGKLSVKDDGDDENADNNQNDVIGPPSPTTATLHAATKTRDLVICNPTAFGTALPNQMSFDILNSITRVAHISSEDWVRIYRFHQVWWPRGQTDGFDRIATALATDVTAVASIARRVVVGLGRSTTSKLFGSVVHATVAQAFAQKPTTTSRDESLAFYGLLGWTLHKIMESSLPSTSQLTLSVLQILPDGHREELQDLLQTKSNGDKPTLQHAGGSMIVKGLTQVPVEASNLKAVGHLMRRALMASTHPRRQPQRGHIVVTLRVFREARQVAGDSSQSASITFVDLAPVTSGPSETVRRDAAVRQTISVLGGVLRGNLLKAAGNQVAIPYRESLLTKVLQGFMDRHDSRTLLLSGISPLKEDYDRGMADLRYCTRIMEKPGEAPKSPFDSLSKTTSPTSQSQMSQSTTASARQIMLEQFDPKYNSDLIRNMTSDPRQRFSRAGLRPARQLVALASSDRDVEAYIPPDYMDIDPGAMPLRPVYDDLPERNNAIPAENRVPLNISASPMATDPAELGLDTTFTLDSMEQGNIEEEEDTMYHAEKTAPTFLQPSPLRTYNGKNDFEVPLDGFRNGFQPTLHPEEPVLDNTEYEAVVETVSEDEDEAVFCEEEVPLNGARAKDDPIDNAEMDALSLEIRRQAPNRIGSESPSDSAMDELSHELLHNGEHTQPEQPNPLEDLEESPIKQMHTTPSGPQSETPADQTHGYFNSEQNYDTRFGEFNGRHLEQPSRSDPPTQTYKHQRPPVTSQRPQHQVQVPPHYVNHASSAENQYYHYETPNLQSNESRDFNRFNPSSNLRPTSDHVDLTMYRVTPRAAGSFPSDMMVKSDNDHLYSNDSNEVAERTEHTEFPRDNSMKGGGERSEAHAVERGFLSVDSSEATSQREPVNTSRETQRQMNSIAPDPSWRNQVSSAVSDERSLPSDGSATEVEIEQIDSIIHKLRKSTRFSSQSITNDLNLIENNQRSVVRRLVEERDDARRNLDSRTEEQLKESTRRDQELRELRRNLEAVHNERRELEQIAEDAVTGREDLEKRALELERALKKKEQESVSRNEYLALQNECENVKILLEEYTNQLSKLKADISEKTATISKMRNDLLDLEQEKHDLQSRLTNEKSAVDRMEERNGKVKAELDSLRSQIALLENERSLVESQLEGTKRSLQLSLDKKDGLAQSLTEQLEHLQAKLHEQGGTITGLRSEMRILAQEKTELQSHLQNEKSAVSMMEERNGQVQAELEYLRSQVIVLENERDLIKSQTGSTRKSLELSLQQKDGFAKGLSEKLEQLQNDFHEQTTTLSNVRSEMNDLAQEKAELHSLLANEKALVDKLEGRSGEVQAELEAMRSQVIVLENERNLAQSNVESTKRNLQLSLEQKDSYSKRLREELEQQQSKTKELQDALWNKEDTVSRLQQESYGYTHKIEELLQKIKELEDEVEYLQKSKEEISQDLSARLEEMKELSQALRQVTKERDEAEGKLEDAERKRIEAETNAKRIESETKSFREEASNRLKSFVQRHKENEAFIKDQESDMRKLLDERQDLNRQMETTNHENQSMRATIEELRTELMEINKTRTTLSHRERSELQSLKISKNELEEVVEELRGQLMEIERKYQLQVEAERTGRFKVEAERDSQRRGDFERAERLRLESEKEVQRQIEEERDRIQMESQRNARRQIEKERERLQVNANEEVNRRIEEERERLRFESQRDARREVAEEREQFRIETERHAQRLMEEIERLRIEAEQAPQLQLDEERERLRVEAEREARRQLDMEREQLRAEAEREIRRQLEEERERYRVKSDRESRRRSEEERKRLRLESERDARRRAEEERTRRRVWGESTQQAANRTTDDERRLRLDASERLGVRDRDFSFDDTPLNFRLYGDHGGSTSSSRVVGEERRGVQGERTLSVRDDYGRLEEVTVALARALHSQTRVDEDDIAHLLRQFHAAEDAIVAHNRYFRTRIEGLRYVAGKK